MCALLNKEQQCETRFAMASNSGCHPSRTATKWQVFKKRINGECTYMHGYTSFCKFSVHSEDFKKNKQFLAVAILEIPKSKVSIRFASQQSQKVS